MKLILAIINDSDVRNVTESMMNGGFSLTKIGSTGGFLKAGMTTMVSAVNNEKLDIALEIIKSSTHSCKYSPSDMAFEPTYKSQMQPNEIVVGGATVFVLNIENSYKF